MAAFVGVPAAKAAPTWLAPVTLTPASDAILSVAAGSDAAGNVTAGWVRWNPGSVDVEVATRPAGGEFSGQVLQSGTGAVSDLTMAVNRNGDAIVAWRRAGATDEIWASTRQARGSFGVPQVIASVPGSTVGHPSVAINQSGAMMVVWALVSGGLDTVYGAYRPPGGSFNSGAISSTDPENRWPRVVLDEAGRATVVWSYLGPGERIGRARVRQPNGTLGAQRNLSGVAPPGYPVFPTVGLDGAGNAVAVWSQWNGSVWEVQGAVRPAALDTWTNLAPFGQSALPSVGNEPQVAVDASGNAVAIWRAANQTIHAATRFGGGGFGDAQTGISAPGVTNPRIALDAGGNAVAIWQRPDGRVEASAKPLGGQFGAVREISTPFPAQPPALSMDSLGNAFAIWSVDDPTLPSTADMVAQFAALDSSAPNFSSVSVPSTATTGVAAGFGAAAGDVWSPVSYHWDFGDGSSGTGANASHTYTRPGTYTVTVSATDAVGNGTGTTRMIQVSSPTPRPPSPTPRITGVTLSYDYRAFRRFTRFTRLQVKGVPRGSTVRAVCAFKRKKCAGKARRAFTKRNARGTISLNNRYRGPRLKVGSTITVRVTKPGHIGVAKTLLIRKRKPPRVSHRCMPVGTTQLRRTC